MGKDLVEKMDNVLGVFESLNCVGDVKERDREEDLLFIGEVKGLVKKFKSFTKSFLLKFRNIYI